MLKCREALLDSRTDGRKGDGAGEAHVPHDRPPHQPSSLVLSSDVGGHKHGHTIRPRYLVDLVPPSGYDDVDIKSQNKNYLATILVNIC